MWDVSKVEMKESLTVPRMVVMKVLVKVEK
jgi:hypothetical protein